MAVRKAAPKGCKAGHKGCTCKLLCCQVAEDRVTEIRSSARSGTNWANIVNYRAACTCGLRAAKGTCYRHGTK